MDARKPKIQVYGQVGAQVDCESHGLELLEQVGKRIFRVIGQKKSRRPKRVVFLKIPRYALCVKLIQEKPRAA